MNRKQKIALIFLLSFSVRALLVIPVLTNGTPPKFDEQSYFRRAVAFDSILESLAHLRSAPEKERDTFYENGIRPPFQSILLSLGMLLMGKSVVVARLMMVLLSALTTVLIFLLTDRLAGPDAGLAAAVLHLVHPSFLAFSHYLWAETTFIFLLFLSVFLAVLIQERPESRRRTGLSIVLGVVLGCLALTRSAALLPMAILPAWILATSKGKRARLLSPVLIVALSLLTILPWEYALYRREHRVVPLANINYRNLYLGHNPWMENAEDDSEDLIPRRVQEAQSESARERSVHIEIAARDLALREITTHFGAFLVRCGREALFLWTFDFFPIRHVVNAAYPPMSDRLVLPLVLIFAASAIVFYLLVLKGLMVRGGSRFRNKLLLLVLVAGGAAPYVLTLGNSRYNLPQIALLLPLAGFGLAHFREKTRGFLPLALLLTAGCLVLFTKSYPEYIYHRLRPSSAYAGPIGRLDKACGTRSLFGDVFFLEDPEAERAAAATVTIVNEDGSDFSFDHLKPLQRLLVVLSPTRKRVSFVVYGHALRGPLKLRLSSPERGGEVELTPTDRAHWDRFQAVGLGGLRLRWQGGR